MKKTKVVKQHLHSLLSNRAQKVARIINKNKRNYGFLKFSTFNIFFLLIILTLAFVYFDRQISITKAVSISPSDWPQLGRDPGKSNASPQTVTGPYRFYWRWTQVPIASRVQPVVVNNILYVGSLNGTFYALQADADNQGGQPTIVWQKVLNTYNPALNLGNISTGDPIRAGAGVDTSDNIVVIGTQHGTIYGLDETTGNTKWTMFTGGAVVASPLMDENGTAYIGSSDGYMYAINTSTGAVCQVPNSLDSYSHLL